MSIEDSKDDLRKEYGKLLLENNTIYKGECVKGQIVGYGELNYQNGQIDKGKFFNGKLHGEGKRIYLDGTIYEGEFYNGEEHGIGKITSKSKISNFKITKIGKWKHGKLEKKLFNKIKIERR